MGQFNKVLWAIDNAHTVTQRANHTSEGLIINYTVMYSEAIHTILNQMDYTRSYKLFMVHTKFKRLSIYKKNPIRSENIYYLLLDLIEQKIINLNLE